VALSIGIAEGSKIQVGTSMLEVNQIFDSRHIAIKYGRQQHLITDAERTEVEPNVFISCGIRQDRASSNSSSRLAFEAPAA
jgi:hypothetical protein